MARKTTSKKKSNIVSVDFEGVEVRKLVPEGDHKVTAIEVTKGDGEEYPYLAWVYETSDGGKLYENTSLSPRALWRLRSVLEAAGVDVPDGPLDIDLDTILEDMEQFGVLVEHESFEGKPQARVVDVYPIEEEGGGKTEKKDKGKKEEEVDPEEVDDMDEDELEELIDKHDLDVDLDDYKTLKKKRAAVKEALEDDGGSGDETKTWTAEAIKEMGTKELQNVIKEAELDVELTGTTSAKRRAVTKALKDKDLLED